jgi:hypothetical protein
MAWFRKPKFIAPVIVALIAALATIIAAIINQPNLVTVRGAVADSNGNAVKNASVEIDGKTTTTDANGVYIINNVSQNVSIIIVIIAGVEIKNTINIQESNETVNYNVEIPPEVKIPPSSIGAKVLSPITQSPSAEPSAKAASEPTITETATAEPPPSETSTVCEPTPTDSLTPEPIPSESITPEPVITELPISESPPIISEPPISEISPSTGTLTPMTEIPPTVPEAPISEVSPATPEPPVSGETPMSETTPPTSEAESTTRAPLQVTITYPERDEQVPYDVIFSGTISGDLPEGQYLWLVKNPQTVPGEWWPQASIEYSIGEWEMQTFLGQENEDIGAEFTVAVITVDEEDDKDLQDYIAEGVEQDSFPGIPLPESATILTEITVIRE